MILRTIQLISHYPNVGLETYLPLGVIIIHYIRMDFALIISTVCLLVCFVIFFLFFFVQVRSWNDLPTYQSYNYRTKNQHEKKRENDCGCCLLFCRVIKFWILFCSSIYLYNIYICFDSKYKNGLVYVEIYVSFFPFFALSLSPSLSFSISEMSALLFELWECSWYMYTKWKWNGGMTRAQRKGHFENEPNINTGKNYK